MGALLSDFKLESRMKSVELQRLQPPYTSLLMTIFHPQACSFRVKTTEPDCHCTIKCGCSQGFQYRTQVWQQTWPESLGVNMTAKSCFENVPCFQSQPRKGSISLKFTLQMIECHCSTCGECLACGQEDCHSDSVKVHRLTPRGPTLTRHAFTLMR